MLPFTFSLDCMAVRVARRVLARTGRGVRTAILLTALSVGSAEPVSAQTLPVVVDEQDAQLWLQFNSQIPVARTWFLILEGQPRWNQNLTRFDQAVFRTGVIKRLTPSIQLSAAYAFVSRHTVLGTLFEHQSYEQVLFTLPRLGKWVPTLRLREDQRYLAEWGDASHRIRESFRMTRPLPGKPAWTLVVYEESFVNLDDTVRGPARGLDQVRLYSGIQHPITKDLAVEFGYMWQELRQLGARPHRRNHNALVQFQFRPRGPGGHSEAPAMPTPASHPTTSGYGGPAAAPADSLQGASNAR